MYPIVCVDGCGPRDGPLRYERGKVSGKAEVFQGKEGGLRHNPSPANSKSVMEETVG